MKKHPFPQFISTLSLFAVLGFVFNACQRDEPFERGASREGSLILPEDVMVYMEFKTKTTMYTEPAAHVDQATLSADQKHAVMSGRVPVITAKRQIFQIKKDKTYRIVIETLQPESNPAREAFRDETQINDWELKRTVIEPNTIISYDFAGRVILSVPNDQDKMFSRVIDKMFSDADFAKKVNIANAFFRLSGGTENYLDPELRSFFVSDQAKYSTRDGMTIMEERVVDQLKHIGAIDQMPPPPKQRPTISSYEEGDKNQTHTSEETMEMIKERAEAESSGRDMSQLKTYTMMDSTSNKIKAEATYAGEEQVLALTFYEVGDDPQRTVKTEYTEMFEVNRAYDLDLTTKVSTEYSDVHIINKFKTPTQDEK